VTGSLQKGKQKGKLADLVVLNQNLTEIDPEQIGDTDSLLTMVGGKKVWVDPSVQDEWGTASAWADD
jgi:predicted amidohydrolase YtcJ